MSAHSVLPPSSAATWGGPNGCRGSVQMVARVPVPPETPESVEGTAVHRLAELLLGFFKLGVPQSDLTGWVGTRCDETGLIYTQEMVDAAEAYADAVYSVVVGADTTALQWMRIEQRVSVKSVHPECWGTPDLVYFDFSMQSDGTLTLHVFDLKYGFVPVDVFECWQLILYAIGTFFAFKNDGNAWVDEINSKVVLHIVQPRKFHNDGPHRTWEFPLDRLRTYSNTLERAAAEAMSPDAPLNPGRHCKYCDARAYCPAFDAKAADSLEYTSAMDLIARDTQAMAVELSHIDDALATLESLKKAFETEIVEKLRGGGGSVPGYAMQPGYGNKTWRDEPENVLAYAQLAHGVDLRSKKLITPKQAVTAGLPPDIAESMSHRPSRGLKLVRDDLNKAKRIFTP